MSKAYIHNICIDSRREGELVYAYMHICNILVGIIVIALALRGGHNVSLIIPTLV